MPCTFGKIEIARARLEACPRAGGGMGAARIWQRSSSSSCFETHRSQACADCVNCVPSMINSLEVQVLYPA